MIVLRHLVGHGSSRSMHFVEVERNSLCVFKDYQVEDPIRDIQ